MIAQNEVYIHIIMEMSWSYNSPLLHAISIGAGDEHFCFNYVPNGKLPEICLSHTIILYNFVMKNVNHMTIEVMTISHFMMDKGVLL